MYSGFEILLDTLRAYQKHTTLQQRICELGIEKTSCETLDRTKTQELIDFYCEHAQKLWAKIGYVEKAKVVPLFEDEKFKMIFEQKFMQ